jgi:peptidoglycan/LPS O-acetylase OafA/YrhL
MNYRSDIDGLRSVAVLPVVAFHYEISKVFSGGYVGVDVFFVISGFLITKIIFDDLQSGTYSIIGFYNRRVRRIFPALFFLFAACLIVAVFDRFPSEIDDLAKSIVYSIVFLSNVFFYSQTSYFDSKLAANPVLHTWSLSVEEQFYVLFPLFMFFLRPLGVRTQKLLIAAVALLSFCASAIQVYTESTAAFYLVQYRAWELLIGGLVAIGVFPKISNRFAAEITALAGFVAILLAVTLYSKTTPFPGLAAALPCCGAAAVIYAGGCSETLVSRILSLALLRFVGLISYSLYLWHWPLFVYASSFFHINRTTKLCLFFEAIVIAAASWRFIELPFRRKPFRLNRIATLGAALGAMIVTSLTALSLGTASEFIWPMPEQAKIALSYEKYDPRHVRAGECFLTSAFDSFASFPKEKCLKFSDHNKNVLILGDSHAAHLWAGYSAVYPDINFMQATASGCKPVEQTKGERRCTDLVKYVLNDYLPNNRLDAIIISARWDVSDIADAVGMAGHLKKYVTRVVISGPIEEYDQALPRILAEAIRSKRDIDLFAASHRLSEQKLTDRQFSSLTLQDGVSYVSVYSTLCQPGCRLWAEVGVPLQFDYGHLTKEGSILLARELGQRALAP